MNPCLLGIAQYGAQFHSPSPPISTGELKGSIQAAFENSLRESGRPAADGPQFTAQSCRLERWSTRSLSAGHPEHLGETSVTIQFGMSFGPQAAVCPVHPFRTLNASLTNTREIQS